MLEGFVYVFQFSDRVKIGFSTRVEERKKQVEAAAGQHVKKVFSAPAPAFVEKLAHDKLKQFRLVGEYFNIPFPEAVKVVKELTEAHKITPAKESKNRSYLENIAKALVIINESKAIGLPDRMQLKKSEYDKKRKNNSFSMRDFALLADSVGCRLAFIDKKENVLIKINLEDTETSTKE